MVRIANTISGATDSIVSPSGDRLGVKAGGIVNWLLPDLHGDIAGSLTQDETTLANAIRYDPYGETLATGTAGGTAVGEKAWTYQGRLDIAPEGLDTPLYDMSARFYAPGIGAFTQLDTYAGTAQHPLSMNRFLYAHANPATLTDPTGHCPALALAGVGLVPGLVVGGGICISGAALALLGLGTAASVGVGAYCIGGGPFDERCPMPQINFQGPSVPQAKVEPAFPELKTEWQEARADPTKWGDDPRPWGEVPGRIELDKAHRRDINDGDFNEHDRGSGSWCQRNRKLCYPGVGLAIAGLIGAAATLGGPAEDGPPSFDSRVPKPRAAPPRLQPTASPQPQTLKGIPKASMPWVLRGAAAAPHGAVVAAVARGSLGVQRTVAAQRRPTPIVWIRMRWGRALL